MAQKKLTDIGVSDSELLTLKTISENLQIKGKSLGEVKDELETLIVNDEKDSIYKFEEIDGKIDKLLVELTSTEEKFRIFEATVSGINEEFVAFYRKSEIIQKQNEFIETRQANQLKLIETLKLLFSGIELSNEEKAILLNPTFETSEKVEEIERVLEKIGKFLKYTKEKYQSFKGFKGQIDEIQGFLKTFLLKYKENIRTLMKKALAKFSEDEIEESRIPETSEIRRSLMGIRRILFSVLLINSEDKVFFQGMTKDIASAISQFLMILEPKFEKAWVKEIENLAIYREKWHFKGDFVGMEPVKKEQIGANQFFEELFLHLRSQLESDENYFAKFFSYEGNNKLSGPSEEIIGFMSESYKDFSRRFEDFLNNLMKVAPFAVFLLDSRAKQALAANPSDLNGPDPFSRVFFKRLRVSILKRKEDIIKDFNDYLEGLEIETRHCGILGCVRAFSRILGGLSWELNLEGDLENEGGDLIRILEVLVRFLQKTSKRKEKYEDALMFGNLSFLVKEAEGFNSPLMKTLVGKLKPLMANHSENYARYLLSYNSTKFMEFWLEIKKLSANEINSDKKYSKSSFNKHLKASFGNIHKSLDKVAKRLKKQLAKDQALVSLAFENYTEYFMREMREIERFFEIHYNDVPVIRKSELDAEFLEKKRVLS